MWTQAEIKKIISDAKGGAKSTVKFTKACASRETPQSRAKLRICKQCDQWDSTWPGGKTCGGTCKVCGCFVQLKVKLDSETCPHPDGPKWGPNIELPQWALKET